MPAMRNFLVVTVLLLTGSSAQGQQHSQAPLPGSNWERVRALPANSMVYVDASSHHGRCSLEAVDAESLTCTSGKKDSVVQRADIKSIKLSHRGRSTALAAGVGAGIGAILGAAGTSSGNGGGFIVINRGAVAAVGAVGGALIGAPIGYFTDLNRSTIYRAP